MVKMIDVVCAIPIPFSRKSRDGNIEILILMKEIAQRVISIWKI